MKMLCVLLSLAVFGLPSCQNLLPYPTTPTVATMPSPSGTGTRTQIKAYHAMVYDDSVIMWAKNGLIRPFEIYVYDLDDKSNGSKAVYARFGPKNLESSWRVGHLLTRTPGIKPVPDTLDPLARDEYVAMAAEAKAKAHSKKQQSKKTVFPIVPQTLDPSGPQNDYQYRYEEYKRPNRGT